jgi:hypothetical protein
MVWFLRVLFVGVLGSMLWVTTWASLHTPLFDIPPEVWKHPWFIATLVDAYWAFTAFYIWVAWKEQSAAARVLWFVAIMLLGNIAMAIYMIDELFSVDSHTELTKIVTRRNEGKFFLPGALAALGIAVLMFA